MFPKTLAELKRTADKFIWTMTFHSWAGGIVVNGNLGSTVLKGPAKLVGTPRKVVVKRTNAIGFEPLAGQSGPSFLQLNGAKGFKFEGNKITVDLGNEGSFNEVMVYELEAL